MGSCLSRSSREPKPKPTHNEHSYIESFYKFGVVGQKSNDGEIHIGLRATKTTKKDREFTSVNGKKKHPIDSEIEERIPSIEDVMSDSNPGVRFEIPQASNNDTINNNTTSSNSDSNATREN